MNLGLRLNLTPRSSVHTFANAEAQTYVEAMSVEPTEARKALIDTLVGGLKADGIWTKLDWLCLLAAHDAQAARLNAVSTGQLLTATNSPTFTTDRGYAGNGTTSFLDFGEAANAAGNQYAQDSACAGAWCNLGAAPTTTTAHLSHDGGIRLRVTARSDGGNEVYAINDATNSTLRASASKTGHRTVVREGAAIKRGYFNGAQVSNLTTASTGAPVGNVQTHNHDGTIFSADRLAAVYFGSKLTATEVGDLHSNLETYLTAIGAN
jgi:hypothetical protein